MATDDLVQITALVPIHLKRAAFARFALSDMKFTHWLRNELERYAYPAPEPKDNTEQHQQGIAHAEQVCVSEE
jgi:hypothetical protein